MQHAMLRARATAGVVLATVAALSTPAHAESASTAVVSSSAPRRGSWIPTGDRFKSRSQLSLCKDMRQLYSVDREIGRGGFGQVHRGRSKQSDAPVAIKHVCKQTTTRDKFLQEVNILRAIGGQSNVVSLCEAFETSDAYVLVTELIDGEELFDHLVNTGVPAEARTQMLVCEIAQTLKYLHAHGVVHGDVKPENILLTAESDRIRLIDFGQSFREHITLERSRCVDSGVTTIAYAAPELIKSQTSRTEAGTSAIDMWGLGVVLYIMLCGFHPFDATNDATDTVLAQRIAAGAFDTSSDEWKALSPAARDLVEQLLQVDALQRITADDVLAHEWLQAGN